MQDLAAFLRAGCVLTSTKFPKHKKSKREETGGVVWKRFREGDCCLIEV